MQQHYKINHANIKEWAKNYDGEPFDGILCDPPYELGFMGKSWDSSGIAFDTEMWADLFRHIKPGGHLLAFSGSRTYHRMAVAIEEAGFEIRDTIIWCYGSGFPKALDISKAIDKMQGNERDKVRHKARPETSGTMSGSSDTRPWIEKSREKGYHEVAGDVPISEQAKLWQGYKTALKPAHEPCVLARKPIEGTVANNVLTHGTGGLNIDGTRVTHSEPVKLASRTGRANASVMSDETVGFDNTKNTMASADPTGRFPANLIHDGSDEVEAVFPNESSRFFYTAKASKSERNAGLEGFEEKVTKVTNMYEMERDNGTMRELASKKNHHPTVKPLSLTKYLATLIKPPTGGRLLVPFSGSGSEMIGALQAGWEYVEGVELTEEYIPIAEARIKYWTAEQQKQTEQLRLV